MVPTSFNQVPSFPALRFCLEAQLWDSPVIVFFSKQEQTSRITEEEAWATCEAECHTSSLFKAFSLEHCSSCDQSGMWAPGDFFLCFSFHLQDRDLLKVLAGFFYQRAVEEEPAVPKGRTFRGQAAASDQILSGKEMRMGGPALSTAPLPLPSQDSNVA